MNDPRNARKVTDWDKWEKIIGRKSTSICRKFTVKSGLLDAEEHEDSEEMRIKKKTRRERRNQKQQWGKEESAAQRGRLKEKAGKYRIFAPGPHFSSFCNDFKKVIQTRSNFNFSFSFNLFSPKSYHMIFRKARSIIFIYINKKSCNFEIFISRLPWR